MPKSASVTVEHAYGCVPVQMLVVVEVVVGVGAVGEEAGKEEVCENKDSLLKVQIFVVAACPSNGPARQHLLAALPCAMLPHFEHLCS